MTITGSDFAGASSVTFGGHQAAFSVTAAGTIVATSPPGVAPGTVDVVVTAPGGTSATSGADQFTYNGPSRPTVVGVASTPDGGGYWLVASDGRVFPFGDAGFYGSASNLALNAPILGMAPTPSGKGYWLVASDGGIFNYGDAGFFGSTRRPAAQQAHRGHRRLARRRGVLAGGLRRRDLQLRRRRVLRLRGGQPINEPVVGMAASPHGGGYWLVASDGGIFSYGDAGFFGSAGSVTLNKPVVGMAASPDGGGYWLVASDGGIFSYGDAGFFGSAGSLTLNKPVVGMAASPDGGGYWLVASDGGVFSYGGAGFEGSVVG